MSTDAIGGGARVGRPLSLVEREALTWAVGVALARADRHERAGRRAFAADMRQWAEALAGLASGVTEAA